MASSDESRPDGQVTLRGRWICYHTFGGDQSRRPLLVTREDVGSTHFHVGSAPLSRTPLDVVAMLTRVPKGFLATPPLHPFLSRGNPPARLLSRAA